VARGSFVAVGDATLAAPAPRFSATPGATTALTEVGADTAALLDELSFTAAELDELRAAAAIA
jgi:alpha-methylacyl-CoA racemase